MIDYKTVHYDGQGRPFWLQDDKPYYIPPATASTLSDPRARAWADSQGFHVDPSGKVNDTSRPGQSLFRNAGTFNSEDGDWDRPLNWTNIASMAIGGVEGGAALAGAGGGGSAAPVVGTGGAGIPATSPVLAGTVSGIPAAAAPAGGSMSILGSLSKYFDIANKVAPILGGAAKGRAEGKQTDFLDSSAADRANADITGKNFDMAQRAREFSMTAPRTRLGTASRGAMAAAGPVKANWGGPGSGMNGQSLHFTGGFMADDPRMREMGNSVMDQELQAQLSGKDNIEAPVIPDATPAPESSFGDKALGVGSTVASILGAIGTLKTKKRPSILSALPKFGPPESMAGPEGTNTNDIWQNHYFDNLA